MAGGEKKTPYFAASFLGRLTRDPSFGGDRTKVMNGFVEYVQAVGDDREGTVRFGSFPIKVFGAAAEQMEKDNLREGDFLEIVDAAVTSQKKYKNGEELHDEEGKPVFELVLVIDDLVGEYVAVYGADDVDEPEKPEKKDKGGRGGSRGGSSRGGKDDDRGSARGGSSRGSRDDERSDDRGDDRGRSTSSRSGGSSRGGSSRGSRR